MDRGAANIGGVAACAAHNSRPTIAGSTLRRDERSQIALASVMLAVGYYLGAKLGLALTLPPRPVAVLWPPNSILLAAFLLTPARAWWFLLLAAFPAHWAAQWQGGVPASMVVCWFISNSCEAFIGAGCIRRLVGNLARFDSVRMVAVFCLCGVILGPFLSSFIDAAFVRMNHWGEGDYWDIWRIRFTSNILAALTITPAIVNWRNFLWDGFRQIPLRRKMEGALLSFGLLSTGFGLYVLYDANSRANVALLYSELPFLLWAALRFGSLGASTAMFVTALLAIWGAAHGAGPFSTGSPEENALSMQLFLTLGTVQLLMLGAAVEERGRAEERFREAFLLCPDPMLICRSTDGRVIEVNKRWQEVLGYSSGQTTGETIFDLDIYAASQDRDRLKTSVSGRLPVRELEICLRTRSGETRQTLVSVDLAEMADEACLIFVVRDVTDRKVAEEAMQNLAHASRLALVGELTGMIAHEVNQPLGAILSNADAAELILDAAPPRLDEVRRILTDIRKDDTRASEAIRRIRTLLKRKQMQTQPLDLNDTADDVMKLVKGDAVRHRVRLQTEFDHHLPAVMGDRVHLQQVLLNLLINGMDAMRDTPVSDRRLTVRTSARNGQAELSVQDAGHGISSENLPRLFESFFTTKQEGMGLGLAIARSIVEAHQGRIWAESPPEGGAIFRISLPALRA